MLRNIPSTYIVPQATRPSMQMPVSGGISLSEAATFQLRFVCFAEKLLPSLRTRGIFTDRIVLQLVALTEAEANSPAVEDLLNTARFDPPDWELIFQMDRRDLFGIWDRNSQVGRILAGLSLQLIFGCTEQGYAPSPDLLTLTVCSNRHCVQRLSEIIP